MTGVALGRLLRGAGQRGPRGAHTHPRVAYQQLHRDPDRLEMAAGILARVPKELDALNEEVVVTACIGLGFTIERPRGRIFAIELGSGALVDGLPGVPGGSSYVGSFDREEALEEEGLDFFVPGIRSWNVSLPTSRRAPSAGSRGSRSQSARSGARDFWPSTRTGPCSRLS